MVDTHLARTRFLDRSDERDALDRLVAGTRAGRSGVLVLRGEAGIGKTALLGYLSGGAEGCRIVRASGVESEMELAFAGLHALCTPVLKHLDRLPAPQRAALRTAFGMSAGPPPDRFLVGLAVLSLLAEVAEEQPLICIIDDVQWLDLVSVQTLAFVARRLLAERIGLVFALRTSAEKHHLEGLPELVIEGLAAPDASQLLDAVVPGRLDAPVRDQILGEAGGNPLALVELARSGKQIAAAGGFGLPMKMPLTSRIEQGFVDQLEPLPAETRRLLLLAAAEPVGDVTLLWRAAERLDIGLGAALPAEEIGLIEIGTRVRFRHPLVRSAAYRVATASERREAHRALAHGTDAHLDPDRRAWHRARAVAGPDESVAGELERSADRAYSRGGLAAAAAFLQQAALLTPDPAARAERSLAAARAKLDVADTAAASSLLAAASLEPMDPFRRARLDLLRAQIVFAEQRGRDAPPLLLNAAKRLDPLDPAMARETYLEAMAAAVYAGRLGTGPDEREVAEAARAANHTLGPGATDQLFGALVTRFTDGYEAAVQPLRRALRLFGEPDASSADRRWMWLACRLAQDLWDDDLWHELATCGARVARETGALHLLPNVLNHLAALNIHCGALETAESAVEETDSIAEATGMPPLKFGAAMLAAVRGDKHEALALFDWGRRNVTARGEGSAIARLWWLTALLHNSHGDYGEALAAARRANEHEDPILHSWARVELIEASVRSGGPLEEANSALDRLTRVTRASGTEWALGIEARCRALLTNDEALYQESLERLGRSRAVTDLARSRLVFGEWLRRENRRMDAREHLRTAHEMFSRMGASAFAERARRELWATGETARKRTTENFSELTAQETQIAHLAAQGRTNPEIAAQLFISPRTVEYHLGKVFPKLGISSRKELRRVLPGMEGAASS
ncbi:regulatory LuxR family protein [Actinocorallia herbida]|uniref:Regulatory LuxR family protein n=1 Tax=Actinocorallia herbida TaxID=58109 RepID=A0A3N1D171_9ACTN|nr:LuxR family transcriptional regulator [Actinocorallia herbida]ROO87262.1 regulatory LuxR family protein [Actinocorallia herbida]